MRLVSYHIRSINTIYVTVLGQLLILEKPDKKEMQNSFSSPLIH